MLYLPEMAELGKIKLDCPCNCKQNLIFFFTVTCG
jgi:hypothetical protein